MKLKVFAFNPFQVNTYLLYTEDGQGMVIDPGMSDPLEQTVFQNYLIQNGIRLLGVVNTHGHVDHVVGNDFVRTVYGVPLHAHELTWNFLQMAPAHGALYGLKISTQQVPDNFLKEGDVLRFGDQELGVIYTPGHADGSICLYHASSKSVFCGDVLFNGSIGRTDLPTGDMETLLDAIRQKLLVLPSDTTAYPGHGPKTTIGFESQTNPFLV